MGKMDRVHNQNKSNSRVVQITKLFQSFTLYLQIKSLSIRDCVRDSSGNPFGFFFKTKRLKRIARRLFLPARPKQTYHYYETHT